MIAVITDHNFDGRIIRGLASRAPELNLIRARDVGLAEAADPDVLDWADEHKRVLLTHDTNTMPKHISARGAVGKTHSGVVMVPQLLGVGRAIADLQIVLECIQEHEWTDLAVYLPL